ncbi:hypothetical protein ACJMK2_042680 [Sinanodonta woodiana]|uniref:3CxxC-type domain-containing protein n=1 Tax=Sinanodonta woodiana TaxID=1069815 RepID=A0ABD3W868_SINWO
MSSKRMYGFFRCTKCNADWESSHVYSKGNEYYKQDCKRCLIAVGPYRVEPIICSVCGEQICTCTERRNIQPNRPHLSHLCEKCKNGHVCGGGGRY